MAKIQKNKYGIVQTKNGFKIAGVVFGEKGKNFYTEDKSKRTVSFGVNINENKAIYCRLQGFTKDKVYFSNGDRTKPETIEVDWAKRMKAPKDGFEVIGTKIGLETGADGRNIVKSMTEYDAAQYLSKNLHDGDSIVIIGEIEYYVANDGTVKRNCVPKQIYLESEAIDFSANDFKEKALFNQTLVFTGLEKEQDENGKYTERFVLSGYNIAYQNICNVNFIINKENAALATKMKKALKPFSSIDVSGYFNVVLNISDEDEIDSGWGTPNELSGKKKINTPVVTEMVIDYANPLSIDAERYDEGSIATAIKKIKADKEARKNFGEKSNVDTVIDNDDWGTDDDSDDSPWD